MIKRILRFLGYTLILLLAGFFFVTGKIVDRMYNKMEEIEDFSVSSEARSLHQNLLVADLHADNLLWDRDPLSRSGFHHVDVPKLIEGNYAIQVFDAVIKTPKNLNYESNNGDTDNNQLLAVVNRWPISSWFSLYDRALHQSEILHDAAYASSSLEIIRNQSDLRHFMGLRKSNSYKIGGILSVEGLQAIEGDINQLDGLYDAGYRIMGLVHFYDNAVGGSSAGEEKGGLTDFGARVIRRMDQKELIIDLAHASDLLIDDVLAATNRPVLVSHTGVRGVYESPRNLSDRHIQAITSKGGLIGIGFWEEAGGDIHPLTVAKSIRYVADLVGVNHVALGSDFDGAVTVGFDASQIVFITEALLQDGFSHAEIKKIMGENIIDFMGSYLPQ